MANPDLAIGALAKPNHDRAKSALRRLQAKADKAVYQAVAERDGYRCRACGDYEGIDIHRHHLIGRSSTTTATVACLCSTCHALLHVRVGGKRLRIYGDADQRDSRGRLCGLTLDQRTVGDVWVSEANR